MRRLKRALSKELIIAILLICLVSVSLVFYANRENSEQAVSEYHAIFLTNEQVYFGKLKNSLFGFVNLSDVYYLQIDDDLQGLGLEDNEQLELSLVKLGNELHGPTNEMRINKDHILFTEELRVDSKVVTAIEERIASGV